MKRTKQDKIRLGVLFVLIIGFFCVLTLRLVHIQIFLSKPYSEIVKKQSTGKVSIPAARGMVYDRNGQLVAKNIFLSSLYAYPDNRRELNEVASYLEELFDLKPGTARKKYGLAVRKFRFIKRCFGESLERRIEADRVPRGLYMRQESQREYPFGLVGKQVLGFTDIDNRGQSGFELAFDTLLAGQKGWADIRRDGLRNTYRVKESALVKPVPGKSLVLTIDWRLQEIVEEELAAAVEKYNAKSAMAVFIDCNNGDILAMAHYDPQEKYRDKPAKLRAITDQFEPGSVFKAFTAAGLLDGGAIDFSDSIFCENGKYKIGRRTLHDDKERGWLDFRGVMELSSNIGIAKCAIEFGGERLMETYKKFGMGEKLRCGLPGETAGRLTPPRTFSPYNVAALAMGHSVAVNTLQLAAGFGAIANSGELLRPRLLLGYVDDGGYVVRGRERDLIGRAMKKSSVDSLKTYLRGVVENGTAQPANSPVIAIAGKTGTAEIPDLENHRYFKNKFMASFAGFFPYEKPVIAGAVVLEDPHPITYGGYTSGPAFRKIAESYSVLNPDLFTAPERMLVENSRRLDKTVDVPDFIGRDIKQARMLAERKGVKLRGTAAEGTVVWQFPPADRILFDSDEVLVVVGESEKSSFEMADLTGLSVRKVAALLNFIGINYTIEGNGRVVKQSVRPGETVTARTVCRLQCRPG